MIRASFLAASMLYFTGGLAAQLDTGQAMSVEFDWSELDLRNDRHQLHGNVRINQGPMSIASEEATASALQTDDSRWTFERAVHLQTTEIDLKSSTATAQFSKGALTEAKVRGSPATFEQRLLPEDKRAKGRASQIDYDLTKGTVTLTKDVWFSYAGNEFCGDVVVYNVRDERVTVNGGCQDKNRVNIRIKPRNGMRIEPPSKTPSAPPASNENGA
jgi:lipopolysaccharide transport protein LptA